MLDNFLNGISPVLAAGVASAITYVLNVTTGVIAKFPSWGKQIVFVGWAEVLAWLGRQGGLDVSSVETFAASLVALGIYHFGKVTAQAK